MTSADLQQLNQLTDLLIRIFRDTIALQDSNVMLTLTKKTISEAQTVKTITFVALVYLPASFTCVSGPLVDFPNPRHKLILLLGIPEYGFCAC